MTADDATTGNPWWASGRDPSDGLDDTQDPVDAHREARRGSDRDGGATAEGGTDPARLASEAIDLVGRLAAEAGRRVAARATANAEGPGSGAFSRPDEEPRPDATATGWRRIAEGIAPHEDGRECDACPVCIGLRALRQARPEVIGHLSDAAHHVSLALRAFADAQAGGDDGLEKIDLDP